MRGNAAGLLHKSNFVMNLDAVKIIPISHNPCEGLDNGTSCVNRTNTQNVF